MLFDGISEIVRRFPDVDLAILHLGGTTLPGGLMVTMDAAQGVEVMEIVSAERGIPIHTENYSVFRSSLAVFRAEVGRRGLTDRVTFVGRSETAPLFP